MSRRIERLGLAVLSMFMLQSCSEIATTPRVQAPSASSKTIVIGIADQFDAQPMMDEFPDQYSTDETSSIPSTAHYDISPVDEAGSAIVCRDHFKPVDLFWMGPNGLVIFHLNPPLLLKRKGPGTYKDKKGQVFANSVYESITKSEGTDATGQRWAFRGEFNAYCRNGHLEIGPLVFGGQMLVALGPITPPYRVGGGSGEDSGYCNTQIIYDPDAQCPGQGGGTGGGEEDNPGSGGNTGGEPSVSIGSGSGGCTVEYIVIEISYDGGETWSTWWEGYANVCS